MSIVVTGGFGFIGSHLVEELVQRGHEVKVIGLPCHLENLEAVQERSKLIRLDIRDRDAVNKAIDLEVEGVLHLAALINVDQSIESPEQFFETNVAATLDIMEVMRKKSIPKLLYMSTCEVYGNIPQGKADENYPTNPRSPYAASKFAADRYLLAYAYTYDKPRITVIRGFNQYGPRQNAGQGGAVIPRFITKLLDGQKIQLYGDGHQTRDYLYVKDTVRGIADAFEKNLPTGEVINLGTGVDTSIRDIAIALCKLTGKEPERYIEFVRERPGELMRSCGDYSKAKRLLAWEPVVSFEQGLSLTFDWYSNR
ncbi:dTDP-glucose 4,6-dehydratase [Chloroflexota bacterium]